MGYGSRCERQGLQRWRTAERPSGHPSACSRSRPATLGVVSTSLPIRRVRRDATVELVGAYAPAARRLSLQRPGYPLLGPGEHAVEEDVPWALQDMAPAGFLGQRFARWFPELRLPLDPRRRDAEDVLRAVAERGCDLPGDLVVGDESWRRYEQVFGAGQRPGPAPGEARTHYPRLVEDALDPAAGSSVGGDRPKFTLRLDDGRGLIVKFTPPLATLLGRRWADLLRLEAHCAATLRAAGVPAVAAGYVELEGRGYLEVERFDRLAGGGRAGAVTLFWLGAARYGEDRDPVAVAERLSAEGWLPAVDARRLALVHAFSAALGNTDAHLGNYALLLDDDGRASLAPAYDVLPMIFAPRHDELPDARVGRRPPPDDPAVLALLEDLARRVEADAGVSPAHRAAWREHVGLA